MAINATPGSPTADSYATVAEGTAFFGASLYPEVWTAATLDLQERSLKMATRLLDAYYKWLGIRTYSDQALGFPRTGLFRDSTVAVDSTTIPVEIRNATIEFSKWLLENNPNVENEAQAQGITEIKVSTIQLKFKEVVEARVIPSFVNLLIPVEWYVGGIPDEDALKSAIFEVV